MDDLAHTDHVLQDIKTERKRQISKFGTNNPLSTGYDVNRIPVLGEEFGEVCRVICERQLDEDHEETTDQHLYKELVQVAAVASSWAESMIRDGRV